MYISIYKYTCVERDAKRERESKGQRTRERERESEREREREGERVNQTVYLYSGIRKYASWES